MINIFNRIIVWCACIAGVFLLVSSGNAQAKGWAVIVGIDSYHSPEISPLAGAVNDADAMADILAQVFAMPEKNILVYTSDNEETRKPTTGRIIKALKYVAQNANPDDLFLFAFSGHGISKHQKSYLLTYYSEMGALEYTALGIDELNEVMATIKCLKKLLIMDACRNNPEKGRGDSDNLMSEMFSKGIGVTPVSSFASGRVLGTLFSCDIGQRSYEWAEKQRGYFSYFLEQGLRGKAADREGRVTLGGLSGYLRNAVPDALKRSLGVDKNQQPYVVMEGGDPSGWVLSEIRGKDWEAEVSRRQHELFRLEKYEAEQQKAKNQMAAEEAAYQQNLAEMDRKILTMQKRLGTSSARSGDSLDAMLAMIAQKEAEQKKMETLKQQRKAEEQKRAQEMKRLQAEKYRNMRNAFEEDAVKYQRIIASSYGKAMGETAWQQLVQKYPDPAKGVLSGDIEKMKSNFYKIAPLINGLGMEFIYIAPGTFMMGSPAGETGRDDDETRHRVTLTVGYCMQTTEVTQGQWKAVMENNPSQFPDCGDDCPVENVSWEDVQEFVRKMNQQEVGYKYRLPTEAEWEYACRAGSTAAYCFGDNPDSLDQYAWYVSNSKSKTHPLVLKQPNEWGLYDMHGNVWEWCSGWYGNYSFGLVTDPDGPSSGDSRVYRGGSWGSLARNCRSADRRRLWPGLRYKVIGFRLVCIPGYQSR